MQIKRASQLTAETSTEEEKHSIYSGKNIGTLKMGKFKSWIVPEIRVLF